MEKKLKTKRSLIRFAITVTILHLLAIVLAGFLFWNREPETTGLQFDSIILAVCISSLLISIFMVSAFIANREKSLEHLHRTINDLVKGGKKAYPHYQPDLRKSKNGLTALLSAEELCIGLHSCVDKLAAHCAREELTIESGTLFETAPIGILKLNSDMRISKANLESQRITRRESAVLLGEDFRELVHFNDLERVEKFLRAALSQQSVADVPVFPIDVDFDIVSRAGQVISLQATALRSEGEVMVLLTELDLIKSADHLRSEFGNKLAANLKQLLQDLTITNEIIEKSNILKSELSHSANDRLKYLSSLIASLCTSDHQSLTSKPAAELCSITQNFVDQVGRIWTTKKNIEILAIVPQGQALFVEIDRLSIERLLQNLINNAEKYSPTNAKILIELTYSDDATATVSVFDEGPGFPEASLPIIFNSYEQGENKDSGFGLGLNICKSIVESGGGKIGAYNRVIARDEAYLSNALLRPDSPAGACVWFSLPVYSPVRVQEKNPFDINEINIADGRNCDPTVATECKE